MVAPIHSSRPKFSLGHVVLTPGALAAFEKTGQRPASFLLRHVGGDWGEVCEGDKKLNDAAVAGGERLMSAYRLTSGERIWIITEADRSVTTLLLPEEY